VYLPAARWSCPVHGALSKDMPASALTSGLCCRPSSSSSLTRTVEQSSLTANPLPGKRNSPFKAFQSCNTCCSAHVLPKYEVLGFFLRQVYNTHDGAWCNNILTISHCVLHHKTTDISTAGMQWGLTCMPAGQFGWLVKSLPYILINKLVFLWHSCLTGILIKTLHLVLRAFLRLQPSRCSAVIRYKCWRCHPGARLAQWWDCWPSCCFTPWPVLARSLSMISMVMRKGKFWSQARVARPRAPVLETKGGKPALCRWWQEPLAHWKESLLAALPSTARKRRRGCLPHQQPCRSDLRLNCKQL